jgi:hypothetical protein
VIASTTPLRDLDISPDGTALALVDGNGAVSVYDLEQRNGQPAGQPGLLGELPREAGSAGPRPILARFLPTDRGKPRRLALALFDERVGDPRGAQSTVTLWEVGTAAPKAVPRPEVEERVEALAVTADGRWIAAGGLDGTVHLWRMNPNGSVVAERALTPVPNHSERILALAAWPNQPMLASGGRDAQIRLWELDRPPAVGAAAVQNSPDLLGTLSHDQRTGQWVTYSPLPALRFDSSIGGETAVTLLQDDGRVISLEQYPSDLREYRLTDLLRQRQRPDLKPRAARMIEAPRIFIRPQTPRRTDQPAARILLTFPNAPKGLKDIRLYHNGIPIQEEWRLEPGQESLTIPVSLVKNENHFYAMASLEGAFDGRTEDTVTIYYEGPEDQPRMHVLALGVRKYDKERYRLQFADADVRDIATYLQNNEIQPKERPGEVITLLDSEVSEANVRKKFEELRQAVRGRPQDRVVLFIACHTDVRGPRPGQEQFLLLLPHFNFLPYPAPIQPGEVLPYATVYRELTRLGALNRVVIIDACRTDALKNDPQFRKVQAFFDTAQQAARTSYILAGRQVDRSGPQPVGEIPALEHGVLSYALLRGMEAPGLKQPPEAEFLSNRNADADNDGTVTTEELGAFAERAVPELARRFHDELVQRSGPSGLAPARPAPEANGKEADSADLSPGGNAIPFVRLPRARATAGRGS